MTAEHELAAERAARPDYGDAMLSISVEATLHDLAAEVRYAPAEQHAYLTRLRSQLTSSRDTYETTGTQRDVTIAYLTTALEHLDRLRSTRAMPAAMLHEYRQQAYARLASSVIR